jgi:hypothetical protein
MFGKHRTPGGTEGTERGAVSQEGRNLDKFGDAHAIRFKHRTEVGESLGDLALTCWGHTAVLRHADLARDHQSAPCALRKNPMCVSVRGDTVGGLLVVITPIVKSSSCSRSQWCEMAQ